MARTNIQVGKKRRFRAIFLDKPLDQGGQPATVDGLPVGQVTNENAASLEDLAGIPDASDPSKFVGLSGAVRHFGPGANDTQISADVARSPDDVRTITLTLESNGLTGEASAGTVEFEGEDVD